jgi:putative tricarboxylic transport membrane protein
MDFFPSFVQLGESLSRVMNWQIFLEVSWAVALGVLFGCLPGLTATMAVALLTGLTFGLDVFHALAILIGLYVGAIYGGSRAAILVNIPGTPASAATSVDGYPLVMKGQASFALSLATTASFIGTIFGLCLLFLISPLLSKLALKFGTHEYFLLSLFGIMICGSVTSKEAIKGWIAGCLGLLISSIGIEAIQAYPRFAYGNIQLSGGIALIPAMIGVFGIPEVIMALQSGTGEKIVQGVGNGFRSILKETLRAMAAVVKYWPVSLRSGAIGSLIGAIPGTGGDIACWVSYDIEKKINKEGEKFGTGKIEGVLAPEVANNAVIGGAFIPMLTLAVPGDAVTAVIAALWLHGIRPGPLLMFEMPHVYYNIVALILVSAIAMLIIGQLLTPLLVKVLAIPKGQLMPVVVVLSIIGAYAINNKMFDVEVMLLFGLIGYFMRLGGFPAAPLTLGIILGPMADENLRRSLMLSNGSILPFFQRPISVILIAVIMMLIYFEVRKNIYKKAKVKPTNA